MTTRETAEKYKYPSFTTETAFEYKYQIATETAEWNTSKWVSAKETALWNIYKYSRIIFFFWSRVNVEKQSWGNRIEVIQGRNGPSLDRYLRWKSFSNSLACSSSVAGNYLELLLVSLYPSHITLYSSLHVLRRSILESTILEISYSGSPSMITGAGRSLEYCWKVLGVASSSIETWNTGWIALMVSRRQSVKNCRLGWAIISYGLRYFSESFFDGRVVWKYYNLTNTNCLTWKSGGSCWWESAEGWYCLWALAISSLSMSCSLLRLSTKSQAQKETISHSKYTLKLGWYPLLAKNGETPVVALGALL